MAKIKEPRSFSKHFRIDRKTLNRLGVLDPSLNVDTKLFIDPLLLVESKHHELSQNAQSHYESYFRTVVQLLSVSQAVGDVPWRGAVRLLTFPEVKWTCLGYGSGSVSGSGSGAFTREQVVKTAQVIVRLGVENPDLFAALALLEDGIGPDRISDMVTNIILPELVAFNARILRELDIPLQRFQKTLPNGIEIDARLPANPYLPDDPVILVPKDILRDLPIAADWSDVAEAAQKNRALRDRVNRQIAKIWSTKSRQDKGELRRWALRDRSSFEILLDMLRGANPKPYDFAADPLGELIWRQIGDDIAQNEPLQLKPPPRKDTAGLVSVVKQIIEQFAFLIEKRDLWKELYHQGSPRPEKSAQRLFFAVAYSYCRANDIDVTPEADTGSGIVDFKFSVGQLRVLVEIKLSTNPNVVSGYEKQLATYIESEDACDAFYIVIDVGRMRKKDQQLLALSNSKPKPKHRPKPTIELIDGTPKRSASKR